MGVNMEVYNNVYVFNDRACKLGKDEVAVVHACKSPCHQRAVGYTKSLPKNHPNYLILEKGENLFLNIIDPPVPLFMPELFISFLDFSRRHWKSGKKLLIHCNQGESRAPSLAMLFLAKGIGAISDHSYESARAEFEKIYPAYNPGKGIQIYFSQNWDQLGSNF